MYVVYEKINIHNNEIFHYCFAILQKTTEERAKTYHESKKPRNTAVATYSAN